MRAKYLALWVTCGVLAGLLYYVYLLAITPGVNKAVEEVTSAVERMAEQTAASNVTIESTN